MIDYFVAGLYRHRVAQAHSAGVLLEAWSGSSSGQRAALAFAQGDPVRAGAIGGGGWQKLAQGDLVGALADVEGATENNQKQLEAEALIAAGAVAPGLLRLRALHERGEPAATLSLIRRLYMFGDYRSAEQVASTLPMHAYAALLGARAAVSRKRYPQAQQFLDPFLSGAASVPESTVASGLIVIAAVVLLKMGQKAQLQNFARRLLLVPDLSEDILPAVARAAWVAGYGKEAWQRFHNQDNSWSAAACMELAVLAGDAALAKTLQAKAGPFGAPSAISIPILEGRLKKSEEEGEAGKFFAQNAKVHVWRTHPDRWYPWIQAALQSPAEVVVYDLSTGQVPGPEVIPGAAFDDGALVELLDPVKVALTQPVAKDAVWVDRALCHGISASFEWPIEETQAIYKGLQRAPSPAAAAVQVLEADQALAVAKTGLPVVAIGTPGDPFWAGPLPEQGWSNMQVIRVNSISGWQGAGTKVMQAVQRLLQLVNPAVMVKPPATVKKTSSAKSPQASKSTKPTKSSKSLKTTAKKNSLTKNRIKKPINKK